jgi:hypothetical protein
MRRIQYRQSVLLRLKRQPIRVGLGEINTVLQQHGGFDKILLVGLLANQMIPYVLPILMIGK